MQLTLWEEKSHSSHVNGEKEKPLPFRPHLPYSITGTNDSEHHRPYPNRLGLARL